MRRRIFALVVVGVTLLVVLAAALARPYGTRLPSGVVIGGVPVGGKTPAETVAAIRAATTGVASKSILVSVEGTTLRIRLKAIGEEPDILPAVERARRSSGSFDRITSRLGLGRSTHVPLLYRYDETKLERVLTPLTKRYEKQMEPATVVVSSSSVKIRDGVPGLAIDHETLDRALTNPYAVNGTVPLTIHRVDPTATAAGAQTAASAARRLLAQKYSIELAGTRYPLPANVLRNSLQFVASGGVVHLRVSRATIDHHLTALFGRAAAAPVNASFDVDGNGKVEIVPSQAGRVVDANTVARSLETHPDIRVIPVSIASQEAPFSTADARALKITDLVGEFRTLFEPGLPRVTNIRLGAKTLNGTILKAHQTFNLNHVLGERTIDKGYVTAPMIDEGELRDSVGGGVSQLATTLYNAAFFAGLKLISHTPHQFWISRYPKGREATVSWGGPELIFRNQWNAPLVILVTTTDHSVTVRMFSRKLGRRVTTGTGDPTDVKPAAERDVLNSALQPGDRQLVQAGGTEGFRISYWRRIFVGSKQISKENFSCTYIPEDTIYEVGPTPAPPPPSPSSSATGSTAQTPPPATSTPTTTSTSTNSTNSK